MNNFLSFCFEYTATAHHYSVNGVLHWCVSAEGNTSTLSAAKKESLSKRISAKDEEKKNSISV